MQTRRALLSATALAVPFALLAACGTASSQTQFEQAKRYADSGIGAVLAAGQQYLKGPPTPSASAAAAVTVAMNDLATLRTSLASVTAPTADWKADALEALALIQQVEPTLLPFLGAAGVFLPLVNAVVTAFVNALPPPANAPQTPPAALVGKSLQYRPR